jgi:GDP-L-fucose synthase
MSSVLILGRGLVGRAIGDYLNRNSGHDVRIIDRSEIDLRNLDALFLFLSKTRPDVLIVAAGVAGGIEKNIEAPYFLGSENSRIIVIVIEVCANLGIDNVINLVPACVYPSNIARRMTAEDLWSGPMEETSLPYSTAKILGITLINAARSQYKVNWISVIATNLYGDHSSNEAHKAHVIPALLMKFTRAKNDGLAEVTLLGDGSPVREFLHVDDFASALMLLIEKELLSDSIINVSGGEVSSIRELAMLIRDVTSYSGQIKFANEGKNGAPVKLLDGSKMLDLGWSPKIGLLEGVTRIFNKNHADLHKRH